jgi:quinol monooxygenase YgiN
MPIVVIATIRPLPEHREAVIEAFKEAIAEVHREPGCIVYALTEAPDRLVMVEQWESRELLAVHSAAPAVTKLGAANAGKLSAAPEVLVLDPIPAGDPNKGQVRP